MQFKLHFIDNLKFYSEINEFSDFILNNFKYSFPRIKLQFCSTLLKPSFKDNCKTKINYESKYLKNSQWSIILQTHLKLSLQATKQINLTVHLSYNNPNSECSSYDQLH